MEYTSLFFSRQLWKKQKGAAFSGFSDRIIWLYDSVLRVGAESFSFLKFLVFC